MTVVAAGLDALVAVAIPLAVLALLGLLVFADRHVSGVSWTTALRGGADTWLLGHGVDIRFTIAPSVAFTATVGLLGGSLVTALCAVRSGRRIAAGSAVLPAAVAGTLVVGIAGGGIAALAADAVAAPNLVEAVLLPAVVWAGGVAFGVALDHHRTGGVVGGVIGAGVRAGMGALSLIAAVSAVAVTVLLMTHLTTIVGLSESLHAGVVGGLAITVGEILLLPTLVAWGGAWFAGPGFAIGSGSAVTPLATSAGPLPALPILGALPGGAGSFGAVALLVPVLAGFAAGALAARSAGRVGRASAPLVGLIAGAVAAALGFVVALDASGAAGPGRLADVGPAPMSVATWLFVEIAASATLAFIVWPRTPIAPTGTD